MCRIEICIRRCKNAYRMFLKAEKRCFLSLLKNLLKPTYTSCELGHRYQSCYTNPGYIATLATNQPWPHSNPTYVITQVTYRRWASGQWWSHGWHSCRWPVGRRLWWCRERPCPPQPQPSAGSKLHAQHTSYLYNRQHHLCTYCAQTLHMLCAPKWKMHEKF